MSIYRLYNKIYYIIVHNLYNFSKSNVFTIIMTCHLLLICMDVNTIPHMPKLTYSQDIKISMDYSVTFNVETRHEQLGMVVH